ncbi:MAG: dipeptide epimerase [Rhodospirillaceae bacterium]|nr:dipeptide epimerase [Rhodospirillaceae bacterium]
MIKVTPQSFRLAKAFTISRGSRLEAHVLTVRISRDGATGWGECVPYARYQETPESVAAQIEGLPHDIGRVELQEALPAGAARNAVDCALWDWEAKKTGTRAWNLARLRPPGPIPVAFTLSLDMPEQMEYEARQHAGQRLLKVKLGTPNDIPRLEAVRRGAPEVKIIVDANEGWSAAEYQALVPYLVDLGVLMVEQPVPAADDGLLAEINRLLPVCADEAVHDRRSLPTLAGKYDMINIKLDKTGGLTEALELRREAEALGYGIMAGCMVGSSLAMAPATLIAQGAAFADLDGPLLLAEDRDHPLHYDTAGVHPPDVALWG